jgi:arylsulfatase A-like enzyme
MPITLRRAAWLLAALLAVSGFPATRAGAPAKPNVVVIMTDDETIEQMRVMTQTRALIGDAGATFETSLSSFPLCCPSRSTFLTGQYAHNHGVLENAPPTGGYYKLNSKNTLPVWLQAAGYHTIHVGKFLNDYGTRDPHEVPPGWSEWYSTIDPTTYQYWGYTMNENGTLHTYGDVNVEDPALYQTDVFRDKAVDAIHRNAGSPFFMTFWTLAPHREVPVLSAQLPPRPAPRHAGLFAGESLPPNPAINEADMSDKPLFMRLKPKLDAAAIAVIENQYRRELESLLAVDEAVGAIVEALTSEGVLDNTYIVFTSDNGYFHGEHRTPDEKILHYEVSSRVPLLMRGPGIAPGTVVREPVANVDLAPTIAALTGATPGLAMDGRSFLPFLADPARRTRRPILLEAFMPVGSTLEFFTDQLPAGAVIPRPEGAQAAALPLPIPLGKAVLPYQAIRTDRYVLAQWITGELELYDLAVDPYEISSKHLDPRYARTLLSLTIALTKLRICHSTACRAAIPPVPDPA